MSVALVLGATGCVGSAIAEGLLARGFVVYGVARSLEAASKLTVAGVRPVVVDNIHHVSSWIGVAESSSVVIEALGDKNDKSTQKVVSEALIALRTRQREKTDVIFTSGIFSYGQDDQNRLRVFSEVDDDYTFSCAASMGRHPVERAYRASGAIVISGAMVYGAGQGPLLHVYGSTILAAKKNNSVASLPSVFGDGSQFLTCVHRRDLGDLYALVAEKAPTLRGQLINACAQLERFDAIVESIAIAVDFPIDQIKYEKPASTDLKGLAYGGNIRVSGQKARQLVGWNPRQPSFCQIVEQEVKMFEARK